jgi:anionic cell wall polymer biosynthesis LytR-Cps2A-Psr (LCP) family protein
MNRHFKLDGFIPRKSGDQLGAGKHANDKHFVASKTKSKLLHTDGSSETRILGKQQLGSSLERSDIEDSLREIDSQNEPAKKLSRRQRRRMARKIKKPRSITGRIVRYLVFIIIISVLAVGGMTAYKLLSASGNIFKDGNILDIFNSHPLKQDSNGRSNFLILGTAEDDEAHIRNGDGSFTDSMMVLSVDQNNKNAYMISIPRDLYVDYDMACDAGYRGKINGYFNCVNSGSTKEEEQERLARIQTFVGDILGVDIQYGIHVNYTVMRDVINAIGGSITVTIESVDPKGQMDSNFDWKCGGSYSLRIKNCPPNGHYIDYPNGPAVLDAEHALYLAQARGDIAPTYGFPLSNPDREKNQQKIMIAIRDKAMSTGTLTNLGSVSKLIDALGDNLRTNIQINEIQTLMQVASEIESSDIQAIDLSIGDDAVLRNDHIDGASVVLPVAGKYQYDDLRNLINKSLTSDPILKESASIVVLNGTEQSGLGQIKASELEGLGFNITVVDNAPDGEYEKVEIYQVGAGNTKTANKLSTMYGVEIKTTPPPLAISGDAGFEIIFGQSSN